MSAKQTYVCDHCGAECTDKFKFSLFGKWARKDAQFIPDNVHGCTRDHTILAVAKILGIGVDGSARELLEALRSELKNTQFKLQKFEDANKVNLAQIDTLKKELGEARERISELESRPDAAEVLQRVRSCMVALDGRTDDAYVNRAVDIAKDAALDVIDAELASLTGPQKPTKPVAGPKYAHADLETKTDDELFDLYMHEIGFFDMNGTMVERANMIETLASISADKAVS